MKATRQHSAHGNEVTVDHEDTPERFVSVWQNTADDPSIDNGFPPPSGEVVAQLLITRGEAEQAASAHMPGASWPVLWIHGETSETTPPFGTQALIFDSRPVDRVRLADRVVGSHWSDEDAEYCLLAGILPADSRETRSSQTISCLHRIEAALGDVGMDFSHVVRTWFYLDDLLAWYDEFNTARTEFFKSRAVFERLIPASTGIGARNPAGAALVAGVLAIRPRHKRVLIEEIVSPLQCPATEYRSSFSRAVEVTSPGRRLLIISGTASIAADGKTMFADDVGKQIDRTLDVVEAILQSREMGWKNMVRAVAYFRDIAALPVFQARCRERGISQRSILPAHLTVCRDDLLFEIEVDALSPLAFTQQKGEIPDSLQPTPN